MKSLAFVLCALFFDVLLDLNFIIQGCRAGKAQSTKYEVHGVIA